MDVKATCGPQPANGEVCSPSEYYRTMNMSHLRSLAGASMVGANAVAVPQEPRQISLPSGTMAAHIVSKTQPQYPAVAKAARIQGTVIVGVVISKDGLVKEAAIVSGPPLLQQAALDAVKTWRYDPYRLNGEPVEVLTQVNVTFALGG
jgi:protein TonB